MGEWVSGWGQGNPSRFPSTTHPHVPVHISVRHSDNAFNDYFTHYVGAGLDLRNDTVPVRDLNGALSLMVLIWADALV